MSESRTAFKILNTPIKNSTYIAGYTSANRKKPDFSLSADGTLKFRKVPMDQYQPKRQHIIGTITIPKAIGIFNNSSVLSMLRMSDIAATIWPKTQRPMTRAKICQDSARSK